jgi:hypothetical protein
MRPMTLCLQPIKFRPYPFSSLSSSPRETRASRACFRHHSPHLLPLHLVFPPRPLWYHFVTPPRLVPWEFQQSCQNSHNMDLEILTV